MALGLLALTFYPGGANDARLAQSHWKRALKLENALQEKNWQGTNTEFKELISTAANAARLQPDNVHYMHWLNVYRWRSMIRTVDPDTNIPVIPKGAGEFFVRLVDEFEKATVLCPTFGPSYCMAGQLQQLTGESALGADNIRKGYLLAPCDATVCFVAGMLDISQAEAISDIAIQSASEKFKRAIKLDGRFFDDVSGICISLDRPDLAVDFAGDNVWYLSKVANRLLEYDSHLEIADAAKSKVTKLLEEKSLEPDVTAGTLASLANIYRRQGLTRQAIETYRRALVMDYGNVNWRLTLSRLLAEDSDIPQAIHEAKIILRLKPNHPPAIKLIQDLSLLPNP